MTLRSAVSEAMSMLACELGCASAAVMLLFAAERLLLAPIGSSGAPSVLGRRIVDACSSLRPARSSSSRAFFLRLMSSRPHRSPSGMLSRIWNSWPQRYLLS